MRWFIASLLILICGMCFSPYNRASAQEVELRKGEDRPSPRVMLVIDVSGSMRNGKIERAVDWALNNVVLTPTDDIEIGIITFNQGSVRHLDEDIDEAGNKITKEWFRLPAAPVLERLQDRLRSLGASGVTIPDVAVRDGFLSGAQSVILITDGDFNGDSNLIKAVTDVRESLRELKRQEPVFFMVAVWPYEEDIIDLQRMADILKIQLWVDERPQDKSD